MQIDLQITVRDMEHSDALDEHIRAKVDKLERIYPKLMGCRVVAELQGRHKSQGRHFAVRVDVTAPGKEVVVNHRHAEDVYVALREAFDAVRRQLEEFARMQQGDAKRQRVAPVSQEGSA